VFQKNSLCFYSKLLSAGTRESLDRSSPASHFKVRANYERIEPVLENSDLAEKAASKIPVYFFFCPSKRNHL